LFRGLGSYLDEEVGLEEQKEEVNQVLRELTKPLIIFIDDVDRLDKDEIKLLFKIVKQTADFDNIRYILSLDEEMVSKSLAASYGGGAELDGKKFIEKIVQLPLRIPELSAEKRYKYTMSLFEGWQKQQQIVVNENELLGFTSKLRTMHRYFISTPRDSKRLINAFEFVETSLKGEVNANDLLLIESIRLFAPSYYQLLLSNPEVLFEGDWDYEGDDKEKKHEEIERVTGLTEEQIQVLITVTSWLFPDHSFPRQKRPLDIHEVYIDDPNEGSVELRKKGLKKNQNIGSKAYFSKYLEFNIGDDQIPDTLFKAVIESFNTKEYSSLVESIAGIKHYASNIIYDKFMLYDDELNEFGKSNLIQFFYTDLSFTNYFDFSNRFMGIYNRGQRIQAYSLNLLANFTKRKHTIMALEYIVNYSTSWHAVSELINLCLNGYKMHDDQEQVETIKVEPNDVVRTIADKFVERVLHGHIEDIYNDPAQNKSYFMFPLFKYLNRLQQLRDLNIKFINEHHSNSVKYLKSFAPLMCIGVKIFFDDNIHPERFSEAEAYASREALLQSLEKAPKSKMMKSLAMYETVDYRTLSDDESVVVQYYRFVALTPD
jgi:hypothetical protein